MNEPGQDAAGSGDHDARPAADRPGGEVRKLLDRAPGERYRASQPPAAGPSSNRRFGRAVAVALGTATVTFALVTFDIGPGLLVIGLAGGWLAGLALAGGAPAGKGTGPGRRRAVTAALLAGCGPAFGLLLDALRAYAMGGVLLPWEYAFARFGAIAPLAIALAVGAGAIRGR
jgi:hypothetical protein